MSNRRTPRTHSPPLSRRRSRGTWVRATRARMQRMGSVRRARPFVRFAQLWSKAAARSLVPIHLRLVDAASRAVLVGVTEPLVAEASEKAGDEAGGEAEGGCLRGQGGC